MARLPFGDIGTGQSEFPYVLMLGQDDNERILGAKLRTFGVDVQWRTELTATCITVLDATDGWDVGRVHDTAQHGPKP